MRTITVFHILLVLVGRRYSFTRAMKPTTRQGNSSLTSPELELCMTETEDFTMDTDDLSAEFGHLNVSLTTASGQCVSNDDGYYSQSINFSEFQNCESIDKVRQESAVDNVPFHDNMSPEEETSSYEQYFSQDVDGDTSLHLALIKRQETVIMWIISIARHAKWLDIPNMLLQTPLHIAVIVQDAIATRRLMTAGARLDLRDVNGNTPLHLACRDGSAEIVSNLLRPVTYTETRENKYDLIYQRIPQDLEISNYDGYNCLHLAAMATHLNVLDLLLKRGANINSKEHKSGRTVLHHAAETNNLDLLVFLLRQRRIDVNAETYGGMTPLRLAAGRNHTTVIELLLSAGACFQLNPEDSFDGS